jgi:hypothetical protein
MTSSSSCSVLFLARHRLTICFFLFHSKIGLLLLVCSLLDIATARPNPVTDEIGSDSEEDMPYKYPDFEKTSDPYWAAFSKELRVKLKEHDRLEINMLGKLRHLDFKLREAWTPTDKPFIEG